MRFLLIFALVFATASFNKTIAQTFTVTSNADSGPGTLRQGLLEAATMGRTSQFTINFQLPGNGSDHANRTIRLRSVLPVVTSNVVIDGSSQSSWAALGVSGAKIIIEPEFANSTFSGLIIGQFSSTGVQTNAVQIYGLYIRNFAAITNLQNVNTNQGSGILIDYRSNDITIGAPGKGNVIGGNINGIVIQNSSSYPNVNPSKIKIQSNLIGLIYDGITAHTNVTGISAALYDCALDVGGDNAGEGNVIAANRINIDIKRSFTTTTRFDINVINNKIGVDYTGQKDFHELPIFLSSSALEISGLKVDAVNTALYVRNNVVGGNRTAGITIANSDFILTGNNVGTDVNGTITMGNGIGIKLENNSTGIIGGATPTEKNTIANNNFGIETTSAKPVKITRNSFFCNRNFGIGRTLTNLQPSIQVLKKNANYVSGKATANAEVELFYTTNCNGICEGKTYIATVQAGSDGRWEYTGALTSGVTATASLLNATTSPFSTAELLPNEAVVEPVTCGANGSITVPEEREGVTFSWVKIETDGTRIPRGNTQSISNLEVGTYEITIDDGCKAFPSRFEIKDQKLTKPTITAPIPSCGQVSFSFTANVLRGKGNIRYQWFNTANAQVGGSATVSLPEGTYYVKVTDDAGCTLSSDAVTIARKPQPKIKSIKPITPAACAKSNGAITGIVLEDVTGTATFEWYKYDDAGLMGTEVIARTIDLVDVEGGNYILKISDESACSPVFSPRYNIPIYNSVAIGNGFPTPTTCGNNNGAIPNITITDADTYEWLDPTGARIIKAAYSPGMNISLKDLAPGTYRLIASNSGYNCSLPRDFIVTALPPQVFTYTEQKNNTTCELINGSITLTYSSVVPSRFEWRDESGTVIPGTVREIKNLPSGNYTLFVWDINGCPSSFGPFTIDNIPKLNITPNSGRPVNDGCSLKRGSVTGVEVIGGVGPYDYRWINEAGDAVQYTKDLINVGFGKYRLEVKDKTNCGYAISQEYTIEDIPFQINTPTVVDLRVCYVSDIAIPIVGAEEGTYQMFASLDDDRPFLETNNGVFNMKVAKTADYFIRRKLGSCISEFTSIHIEVTHDNLELGNVMTPNGDGLNDTWMVKGLPDFKGNNIKIYTRNGQLVYESIGNYTKPFDGRFRGQDLPAGVYFYIIDLRAECKPISGSITLLR